MDAMSNVYAMVEKDAKTQRWVFSIMCSTTDETLEESKRDYISRDGAMKAAMKVMDRVEKELEA